MAYPRGRFRIVWTDDFIGTLVPHVQHTRGVVRLLEADAMLRSQAGDAAGPRSASGSGLGY